MHNRSSSLGIIYLIIGLVVAYSNGYLEGLTSVSNLLSALLAIIGWPLLLLGVNLRITL